MSGAPASVFAAEMLTLRPLAPMRPEDLLEVHAIEQDVYPHPWTHGNFLDSLYSGYECWTLRDGNALLMAYYLMMLAVDEAHLLNITVRRDCQGQGVGRNLLDQVAALARDKRMDSVLLEVRPSNVRARAVYQRYGFLTIGRRKGYYPAADNVREDAIVMKLKL